MSRGLLGSGGDGQALWVAIAIAGWYVSSSVSNNTNKQILSLYPRPMLLSVVQLGCMAVYSCLYLLQKGKLQAVTVHQFARFILPLSISNFCSRLFTYTSLQEVPVSFLHTVKATSPLFTVLISFLVYRKPYSWKLILSLMPVVIGVTICTFAEASVSAFGLMAAFMSTIIFVGQNLYSKSVFERLDPTVLAAYSAAFACLTNMPLMLWWEFYEPVVDAAGGELVVQTAEMSMEGTRTAALLSLFSIFFVNSICHWVQNVLAFYVLSGVTPLTYSIMNTLKRLFVIGVSIVWFHQPITLSNALGILVAVSGVFLYNRVKQMEMANKAKQKVDVPVVGGYDEPVLPLKEVRSRFSLAGGALAPMASATGSTVTLPAVSLQESAVRVV